MQGDLVSTGQEVIRKHFKKIPLNEIFSLAQPKVIISSG